MILLDQKHPTMPSAGVASDVTLTIFIQKGYKIGEKTTAQSTSELLPKHQTSEIPLKISEVVTSDAHHPRVHIRKVPAL